MFHPLLATAITDALTAAGGLAAALVLAVTAWFAFRQFDTTKKDARVRWAMDIHREWDEQLAPVRQLVTTYGRTPEMLRASIEKLWKANHLDYYTCLREPAYWDRIAVLVKGDHISRDALFKLVGPDVCFRWDLWAPTIRQFLQTELGFSNAFDQFEWLAGEAAKYRKEYRYAPGSLGGDYKGPR